MRTFQELTQGEWHHVLRWPVIVPGGHYGMAPLLSWERMVSAERTLGR